MIWSPDIYNKAWEFATRAHKNQTYGGRKEDEQIPYLNHIGSVAMEIINAIQLTNTEFDKNLAIQCALLHDTIEDTIHTYEDIKTLFGKNVADGVLALTKDETLNTKEAMMLDSLDRIKNQPHEIWMVKMADRICNLYHPPFYWNNDKKIIYQKEAITIHTELKSASKYLSERLLSKIDNYSSFIK
ncbi:HD domain-containing protein [Aquimarina agarilytica]|uniref:HD domain-containing protein n=1 Tax=Aquimarina agarilytica TaxID=1087449 RepID=UPI0002890310|nr:HD domain-containing protein [Aquimarina agarilytica]